MDDKDGAKQTTNRQDTKRERERATNGNEEGNQIKGINRDKYESQREKTASSKNK